jgi:acyl-CoA reductase-like NAD-dependent aldehyde dehydrogenase
MEPLIAMSIQTVNPTTNKAVKSFDEMMERSVDIKVGQAQSAIERGKKIADQIDTGMVFINHPTWTQADLPFGGTKSSGFGRELSALGVQEFVNKKLIRVSELGDPF